ncbi:MAG: hypothetical protein RI568_12600 [Natronomonas sp.]|nr:hypothetical protein [Natronomonas sp.]
MGAIERCDVKGCHEPAIARVLPTHGRTDDGAFRCRECFRYDLDREWFKQWKGAIRRDAFEEADR